MATIVPDILEPKTLRLIHSRWGLVGIGVISALESMLLPVALEILVIPIMAAYRRRALAMAAAMVLGSLAGAVICYYCGLLLFDQLAEPLLRRAGWMADFERFSRELESAGFWPIFLVSLSPVPMQVATIGAGAAEVPMHVFVAAILLSRGIRYFAVAGLAILVGHHFQDYLERHRSKMVLAGLVLFAGSAFVLYDQFPGTG